MARLPRTSEETDDYGSTIIGRCIDREVVREVSRVDCSALQDAELPESGHPVLGVPCSNDLPVSEFVNVDRHYLERFVRGGDAHERTALRSSDLRADDNFVSVAKDLGDIDLKVGKGLHEHLQPRLGPCRTFRL